MAFSIGVRLGEGGKEVAADRHGVSFGGDENILNLHRGIMGCTAVNMQHSVL